MHQLDRRQRPGSEPARRSRHPSRVCLAWGGLFLLAAAGCGSDPRTTDSGLTVPPHQREHRVVYEIHGPGKADITHHGALFGDEVELARQRLPWRKEITVTGDHPLKVTASVPGMQPPDAPYTCRIWLDGEEVVHESEPITVMCVTK